MPTTRLGDAASGAKAEDARPPIGCTEILSREVLAKLRSAAIEFKIHHPGVKPTRAEASLSAGASMIASEVLGFGFEEVEIFDTPIGWATSLTFQDGIDWTTAGRMFDAGDLRCEIPMRLAASAVRALFSGFDVLSGNPDVLGIALAVQRRAELTNGSFQAVLNDALSITARILTSNHAGIEQAAALVERDGRVTREARGVPTLLAVARAVPITELPPAPEQARKLARLIGACRMDIEGLAREVSRLAREQRK